MEGGSVQFVTWSKIFVFTGLAFLFQIKSARAYLDPGTASLILQGIIGAIAAGIVTLGIYWRKFTGLFRRKKGDDESSGPPAADNTR